MKKEVKHEHSSKYNLRDIILGGQDGLVNVLGIVLAVATATKDIRIVLITGLAATFAESLSMAAVAYTSTKATRDYYLSVIQEEEKDIKLTPKKHKRKVKEIYSRKGFKGILLNNIVRHVISDKKLWVNTMVSEDLGVSQEQYTSPLKSAIVVGLAAVIGSLVPLVPFIFSFDYRITFALVLSILVLFITGAVKAKLTIGNWIRSGLEISVIGILAALIGYVIGLALGTI
ncbi:MAG: VIT1/CCC1 transporter family protein [Candidatus Nanoarchaeia archaeon]|jgi:VIT1/CCC1 family predicted Fe2+/Mn2+ transporter|nr:VIT1/CCC1 transporter family protein [Candidatus Nanoarchaeia archaeon]|tara:strand:+ start:7225 stop:7914 length:690 start_codon:yes stop_codon:yes gene_type:complete